MIWKIRKRLIVSLFAFVSLVASQARAVIESVSGPPSSAGTLAERIDPPSHVLDDIVANTGMQGFHEGQVRTTVPHTFDDGVIPAGRVVDSYMIFLNPVNDEYISHSGVDWTFSSPIIGVMSDMPGMLEYASTFELGAPGTVYPTAPLDYRGMESEDSYDVKGRTLSVTLAATWPGDWIRVITADVTGPWAYAYPGCYDRKVVTFGGRVSDESSGYSTIAKAEYSYSVGGWFWLPMAAADGAWDSPSEEVEADLGFSMMDVLPLKIRGTDAAGNTGEESETELVALYDDETDSIAGAGKILLLPGDYTPNPSLEGYVRFGFVSEWDSKKKGNQTILGYARFVLRIAHMDFHVNRYSVKVNVYKSDKAVTFKGTGTLANVVDCKFMIRAEDLGAGDRISIELWTEGSHDEETIIFSKDTRFLIEGDIVINKADD